MITTEQFLRKLNLLSEGAQTDKVRRMELLSLLKQGYESDVEIYVSCKPPKNGVTQFSYLGDRNFRVFSCYSNLEHARKEWRAGPDGTKMVPMLASFRELLNNMFHRKTAAGIIINPENKKNAMIVLKAELEMMIPGPKDKPENFVEG